MRLASMGRRDLFRHAGRGIGRLRTDSRAPSADFADEWRFCLPPLAISMPKLTHCSAISHTEITSAFVLKLRMLIY